MCCMRTYCFRRTADRSLLETLCHNIWDKVVTRPSGEVELLVGNNYSGLHPFQIETYINIKVVKSKFGSGFSLVGSHSSLKPLNNHSNLSSSRIQASVRATNLTFKSVLISDGSATTSVSASSDTAVSIADGSATTSVDSSCDTAVLISDHSSTTSVGASSDTAVLIADGSATTSVDSSQYSIVSLLDGYSETSFNATSRDAANFVNSSTAMLVGSINNSHVISKGSTDETFDGATMVEEQ